MEMMFNALMVLLMGSLFLSLLQGDGESPPAAAEVEVVQAAEFTILYVRSEHNLPAGDCSAVIRLSDELHKDWCVCGFKGLQPTYLLLRDDLPPIRQRREIEFSLYRFEPGPNNFRIALVARKTGLDLDQAKKLLARGGSVTVTVKPLNYSLKD